MAVERIEAWLRARDAARFQADMKKSGRSVRDLGTAGKVGAAGLHVLRKSGESAASVLGSVGRASRYVLTGVGLVGAGAVKMGLDFNAGMETSTIAFAKMLGSAQAATDYLDKLYNLAAKTPFEFQPLTQVTQRLMAMGFSADQALQTLTAVGDAVATLGTGQEGIDRITLALGQMKASSYLRGGDLLQLQQAGINTNQALLDAKLMTKDDVGQVGLLHINSDKGIKAITDYMNKQYGGGAMMQSKTWTGLISSSKDYFRQTMGAITEPLFDIGKKRVLPQFVDTMQEITKIARRKDVTLQWKIDHAQAVIEKNFGPLWRDLQVWWGRNRMNERIGALFGDALAVMVTQAAAAAPKIVEAFIHAWLASGLWGKLFMAGWLLKKVGVFSMLGDVAAQRFMRRFGYTTSAELPKQMGGSKLGGFWGKLGSKWGRLLGVGLAAGVILELPNLMQKAGKTLGLGEAWDHEAKRGFKPLLGPLAPEDIAVSPREKKYMQKPDYKQFDRRSINIGSWAVDQQRRAGSKAPWETYQVVGLHGENPDHDQWRKLGIPLQGDKAVAPVRGAKLAKGKKVAPIDKSMIEGKEGEKTIIVPIYLNKREIGRAMAKDTADEKARR